MSLLSDNVIPGSHGKVFGTNAEKNEELVKIKNKLLELDGIKDVIIDYHKFPREFTIHTSELVQIKEIEDCVKTLGFHLIPKGIFQI